MRKGDTSLDFVTKAPYSCVVLAFLSCPSRDKCMALKVTLIYLS